jgi:hypothetical protein
MGEGLLMVTVGVRTVRHAAGGKCTTASNLCWRWLSVQNTPVCGAHLVALPSLGVWIPQVLTSRAVPLSLASSVVSAVCSVAVDYSNIERVHTISYKVLKLNYVCATHSTTAAEGTWIVTSAHSFRLSCTAACTRKV